MISLYLPTAKGPLIQKQSTQFVCTHQPHNATLLLQTCVNRSPWQMASAHMSTHLSHQPSPGMICHSIHETCSPILSVEKQLLPMSEEFSEHKEPTQSSSKPDIAYIKSFLINSNCTCKGRLSSVYLQEDECPKKMHGFASIFNQHRPLQLTPNNHTNCGMNSTYCLEMLILGHI